MVSWDEVAPHSCGGGVVPEWHHSCARLAWCLVAVKSTSSATAPAPLALATACATNSNLSFIFHPKVPPRFTHQACNSKPLHSFLCQSWLFVLKQVSALTPIKEGTYTHHESGDCRMWSNVKCRMWSSSLSGEIHFLSYTPLHSIPRLYHWYCESPPVVLSPLLLLHCDHNVVFTQCLPLWFYGQIRRSA